MTPKIGRIDAKNAPSDQPTPGPGADTDATMYAIIRIASIFFQSIENKSTYQAYPVYVHYGNSDDCLCKFYIDGLVCEIKYFASIRGQKHAGIQIRVSRIKCSLSL